MDTQHYQPLSAALVSQPATLLQPDRSPQQHYPAAGQQYYPAHPHHPHPQSASNGATYQHPAAPAAAHREEEEEEAEDDEDDDVAQDDDLDHHDKDRPSPSTHSSPRTQAVHPAKPPGPAAPNVHYNPQPPANPHDASQNADDSKRKPGRPRGSRNRKPRAAPATSSKAPSNSQHPGFYQYPPPPAGTTVQNQAFYEFQWRALNLCSEFYNAAEELIKAASPVVISQCYQLGPGTKIDPMALIADAKRVCDNLLANPSQLVGQPPPATPSYPGVTGYTGMPPPPTPMPQATSASASGSVISNPQSFVMPLSAPPAPYPPQPYYAPPGYPAPGPGSRYPTAPYYPYAPAASPYYAAPPTQSAPPPNSTPAPPPPGSGAGTPAPPPAPSSSTPSAPAVPPGSLSAFNASTGNAAPGGTQGAWSTEETNRLKQLAEQSRDMSQNKGEIEWDWVVQQWGNSRTRHQILLKATSLGLKESTTRGTKRRRGEDAASNEEPQRSAPGPASSASGAPSSVPPPVTAVAPSTTYAAPPPTASGVSPGHSSATATSNPPSANASPATQPQRPPSSATMPAPTTARSTQVAGIAWPMPTIAANTPSPVMANNTIDPTRANYYRPRVVAAPQQQPPQQQQQQTSYAGATTSPSSARPASSHGRTQHPYMFNPQQGSAPASSGRRENGM